MCIACVQWQACAYVCTYYAQCLLTCVNVGGPQTWKSILTLNKMKVFV